MKKLGIMFWLLSWPWSLWAEEPVPGLFPHSPAPAALYVLERGGLTNPDWHLAAILQGMASRSGPGLYLVDSQSPTRGDEIFLSYYEQEYGIRNLGRIGVVEALKKFSGLFHGYAVFSFAEDWTVNAADTYCSIHDCLPVTAEQEALARGAGLKKIADFRGKWKTAQDALRWGLAELWPRCSKQVVASLSPRIHTCRDYLFAHKVFTFYLVANGDQYDSLRRLLRQLPRDIPVMGYIARSGIEEWIVEYTLAASSKFMIPTDHVPNLSVHSGIPIRPLPVPPPPPPAPDLHGKLGVVFAFTDGDNLFIEAERYLKPDSWLHPQRGQIQAAWSFAPELYELAPGIARYYYQTRTAQDSFVALSGAGYTFTSAFRDHEFFRTVSLEYMNRSGLDTLWSLDPLLYLALDRRVIARVLDPLGAEGDVQGVLAGYAPALNFRSWMKPAGYPPILFCKTNYFVIGETMLLRMISAEAASVPQRGKVVFYGVNGWEVSYEELLAIQRHFRDREDIVWLSPPQAFAAIRSWSP